MLNLKDHPASNTGSLPPESASLQLRLQKLIEAKEFGTALKYAVLLLKDNPQDGRLLEITSSIYFEVGDAKTAISLMEIVVEQYPTNLPYRLKLADMRKFAGDKMGAIADLKTALKIDRNLVYALHELNKHTPFEKGSSQFSRLKKISRAKGSSSWDRTFAYNSLGLIEEKAGNHKVAFRYFTNANKPLRAKYDGEGYTRDVDLQVSEYEKFGNLGDEESLPQAIFVCGLPRSGTTLVESILTRHSDVESVGENYALAEVRARVVAKAGSEEGIWKWLKAATKSDLEALRKIYLQRSFNRKPRQKNVFVDKMPLNCLDIGIAQSLLPNAKFIFMMRHPLDTGLSNYVTIFGESNGFAARLPWIGQMTREVYRSAEDYKRKLGEKMRMQSFRLLVQETGSQVSEMLDYCGLSWQEDCLRPESGKQIVKTASTMQVRQPINTRGLEKWKSYEKDLQPLRDSLGDDWLEHWHKLDSKRWDT